MKLSLVVLTPGKWEKKVLSVSVFPFIVGRDPECHLRPASPTISKKHCALLDLDGKVVVRDFKSTNGTFLNGQRVEGEAELHHGDTLKAGPLEFRAVVEKSSAKVATAAPGADTATAGLEDSAYELLLTMPEDKAGTGAANPSSSSTILDPGAAAPVATPGEAAAAAKPEKKADTSQAASAILDKYLRRGR